MSPALPAGRRAGDKIQRGVMIMALTMLLAMVVVAILLGSPGNNVTTLRTKGFKDQIAKVAPDIKIVFEQTGQFSREEGQKVFASMNPLQRMADPAELAAAAAFLASSDSSFMTASEVAVDGGLAQL